MPTKTEDLVSGFIVLAKRKKDLESELKGIKTQIADAERELVEEWEKTGTSQVKMDGVTVYLKRQLWAGYEGDKDDLIAALKQDADMEFMIHETYNSNTLSSFVRELQPDPATGLPEIPAHLKGKLKVTEKFTIGTRS